MKSSSIRKIKPAARVAAALILLFAASGLLFAQTQEPVAPASEPAAQASIPVVPAAEPVAPASTPAASFFADAVAADREIIAKAEELATQGKWHSAWALLSEYDTANANAFILAEKIRLALDGYAQNTLHLVFGFVDLAEGQDLEFARSGGVDISDPVEFNPGDLAKAIEDKGEAIPPVLSMMLGDFYHTVWTNYQGQWLQPDEEILAKCAENYERALAYDTFTVQSLDRHSAILVALQRFEAAESVLGKLLAIEPDNHLLSLRLAEIYFSTGRYAEIYPLVDKVIAVAVDPTELNNAYVQAIKAGLASSDKVTLEKYVTGFELSFPSEYIPGLIRHVVAVQLGDAVAADAAADAVTAAFPGNPDVIRSVLSTWLSVNDSESGFKYLERSIAKAEGDEALAALHFYKALLSGETAQTPESITLALTDLEKAEEYFKKSYPEGNEVFGMIAELKTQWTEALKAAQAQQSAAPATAAPATEATATATTVPADATVAPADAAATTTTTVAPAEGGTTEADATSGATE